MKKPLHCRVTTIVLLILSIPTYLQAADYYVDLRNGDDKQPGSAAESAWKSLRRVNSAEFKPGDRVLFRRGRIWRGTLNVVSGVADKPVLYSSYGAESDPKPRIIGSVDLSNPEQWQPAGRNIWRTRADTVTVGRERVAFAQGEWQIYCEEKANVDLKIAKTEDNQKLYRLTCRSSGNAASHIQFNNLSFAVESGRTCVYRFRARATVPFSLSHVALIKSGAPWSRYGSASGTIEIEKEWNDFDLLCHPERDADDARLTFFLGKNLPEGCVLEFIPRGALEAQVQTIGLKADIGNVILAENAQSKKSAAFKRWDLESLKKKNDFYSDPFSPSAGPRTIYFHSEKNPGTLYDFIEAAQKNSTATMGGRKHFVIDGLAFGYTGAHGINGAAVQNSIIRNCDFFWIGGGHLYTRNDRPTRYGNGIEFWCASDNNLVENCRFWQIYDTAMTNQGPDASLVRKMTWRNNVIYLCEQAYEIWLSNKESEVEALIYEGNRSYDCGFGWSHVQRPNKRGAHLLGYRLESRKIDITYRNNFFCNTADSMIWFSNPRLAEVECNDNIYWQEGPAPEKQKLFMWIGQKLPGVAFKEYREKTDNDSDSRFQPIERIEYFDY